MIIAPLNRKIIIVSQDLYKWQKNEHYVPDKDIIIDEQV